MKEKLLAALIGAVITTIGFQLVPSVESTTEYLPQLILIPNPDSRFVHTPYEAKLERL